MDAVSARLKRRGPIQSGLHIWKNTVSAVFYKQVLEQRMLPSRQHLFQGLAYYSRTTLNHILQQHDFGVEESK